MYALHGERISSKDVGPRPGLEQSPPVRTSPAQQPGDYTPVQPLKHLHVSPGGLSMPRLPAFKWQTVDAKAWLSAHRHTLTPEGTRQLPTARVPRPALQCRATGGLYFSLTKEKGTQVKPGGKSFFPNDMSLLHV